MTAALAAIWLTSVLYAQQTPETFLGFQVGADFRLARWERIVEYFEHVADASDRVLLEEIGRTGRDNPLIMATIAAPATLRDRDRYRGMQRQLADPRLVPEGRETALLADAKTVIMIMCNIHATEIASSQMAMELLYELATATDPATREILDDVIVLLIPSVNPDGVGIVIDWYERTLGTPFEGSGPPWLYHPTAGHDNNRDWFMLNLPETRHITKVLYKEWFPVVALDVHQQGRDRGRLFVPPYYEPLNPNIHPLINEMQKVIGGHMAAELNAAGKKGVNSYAQYDNWWHGGNRTTPYRHNIVGLLTEAASVRIASPVFLTFNDLKGGRNFPDHNKAVTFPDPWPGGWWRLRDIVEYELIAIRSLLTLGARYRDQFNANYLKMGRDAIAAGSADSPYAWLVPRDQWDQPTAGTMLDILHQGGLDIQQAQAAFTADNVDYPAGTWIIPAAQPYRNHAKDLLEPQDYPDRRITPGGKPDPPYDTAGWTLSFQMGVQTVSVAGAFDVERETVTAFTPQGRVRDGSAGYGYAVANRANNDRILINRYLQADGREVEMVQEPLRVGNVDFDHGAVIFPRLSGDAARQFQEDALALGVDCIPVNREPDVARVGIRQPRLALYGPWQSNMDEGWTRLVLEQFEFPYTTLRNAEIRAGRLRERYDVIIVAAQSAAGIKNGNDRNFPEYIGGVGEEGTVNLRAFVESGGTVIFFGQACSFGIEEFQLPVTNVLEDLNQEEFFCPGSVLAIDVDPVHAVAWGMPRRASAYFRDGLAFDLENETTPTDDLDSPIEGPAAEIIATYASRDVLRSGYLIGPEHLQNRAAAVVAYLGEGRVVLFGFRPQHRAQPHGTYKMIFNAIYYGVM